MKKELYGLRQLPISWYSRIDSYLTQNGLHRSENELTLYTKGKVNETTPTRVIKGLKSSKDDDGSIVDPTIIKRIAGSLVYLTVTRPEIIYGVNLISRFMDSPK